MENNALNFPSIELFHSIINPDFAFKNLIRSKPASRSFCGTQVLSALQGFEMQVLNGPI